MILLSPASVQSLLAPRALWAVPADAQRPEVLPPGASVGVTGPAELLASVLKYLLWLAGRMPTWRRSPSSDRSVSRSRLVGTGEALDNRALDTDTQLQEAASRQVLRSGQLQR